MEVSPSPAHLFGFRPSMLEGRNLRECLDVFHQLPISNGPRGLDVEHVLAALVSKYAAIQLPFHQHRIKRAG